MVRVAISVEGATEERFSELVLKPYLEQKNIFITPINIFCRQIITNIKNYFNPKISV